MGDNQTHADAASQKSGDRLAGFAVVLGVLSLLGLGPITGLPAILWGVTALRRIGGARTRGRTVARAAVAMGTVSLVLSAVLFGYLVTGHPLPRPKINFSWRRQHHRGEIRPRPHWDLRHIRGAKIGEYLARHYPGDRVVVLLEHSFLYGTNRLHERPRPSLDGLREGIATDMTVVAAIEALWPEDTRKAFLAKNSPPGMQDNEVLPTMLPPFGYWFTGKELDETLAPYKGKYDIVVTTIGLPQNGLEDSVVWKSGVRLPCSTAASTSTTNSLRTGPSSPLSPTTQEPPLATLLSPKTPTRPSTDASSCSPPRM